eukprot:PhM_4_TR10291/c0_g2_i1/m.2669
MNDDSLLKAHAMDHESAHRHDSDSDGEVFGIADELERQIKEAIECHGIVGAKIRTEADTERFVVVELKGAEGTAEASFSVHTGVKCLITGNYFEDIHSWLMNLSESYRVNFFDRIASAFPQTAATPS